MDNQNLTLRREKPDDYHTVEALTREAFWNHHVPGCDEHYLAHILRDSPAFVPELDYVAEVDGQLVGSILYTNASILRDDDASELGVLSFGPISVLPAFQRQGIGRRLIRHTATLARAAGYSAILIYGDPAYYGRQGFVPAENFGIATSDNLYHNALQAMELQPGALGTAGGRFVEDPVYAVDAAASEAFDLQFPPKPKVEDTPSQRRFRETLAMCRPRE